MENITIVLPDGSEKIVEKHTLPLEIAEGISKSLAKKAIAAKLNGEVIELNRPLTEGGELHILTPEDEEALTVLRHTAAHILAQAIKRLYPEAHFGVGPAIENGFYYDVDTDQPITEEELKNIEKTMMAIVKENHAIEREEVSKETAKEMFKE